MGRHGLAHEQAMRGTTVDSAALYRLLTWFSPAFPIGAYSYSHGLEYAVAQGWVKNRESLTRWIRAMLLCGSGAVDGAIFCAAWREASAGSAPGLKEVAGFAAAFRPSSEIALESMAQGAAFASMVGEMSCDHPMLAEIAREMSGRVAYPVAAGVACAGGEIPVDAGVQAYLHGFAANLVSAGVRLIPLGQVDGLRAIKALEPNVLDSAMQALETPLELLASSTPMVDWTSVQHETQRTRLFRS